MVKQKKMSKTSIAVIVLALLLVLSLIMGMTGAWFTSKYDSQGAAQDNIGFGKVLIKGAGEAEIKVNTYEGNVGLMVDGDTIEVSDNITVTNESTVKTLYIVDKAFTVTVNAGAGFDAADLARWFLDDSTPTPQGLATHSYAQKGHLAIPDASGSQITLEGLNKTFTLQGGQDATKKANGVQGTFKIEVTAHIYVVQEGNLKVEGDNAATLANVKAAFRAAGYGAYESLTVDDLALFGLAA
jgi:hypothetical protein